MKHLKSYKIFEDKDEDNEVPEGFEYSWNDIYESLLYLTDIGFEIDEKSQKRYLADEKGREVKGVYGGDYYNREYKSNIELAKNAIYEIKLFKKKESNKIHKEVSTGGYSNRTNHYYLDSDVEELLRIYEEIASFCNHFDKAYHNLTIEEGGYSVWLVASSDVTGDFINKKLDDELNSKVNSKINGQVWDTFRRLSSSNKFFTKKFRESFFSGSLGSIKGGVAIYLFDWNSVTKGVYNTNSDQLDNAIDSILGTFNNTGYWNYGKFGYKAEFRELKESDFTNLKEDWQITKLKKYVGTKAIIVKFDYNTVFKKVKEELSQKEED
jgi:hypothetical protein